jgi:flagellar hook-length control protein FliK
MSANLSTNISTDISEHEQATSDELSVAAQQSRSANSATNNISANLSANISTDVGEHELVTADELSVAAQQNPSANSVINNISADVSADELATSDELSVAVPQNPSANSATNNISANMSANMSIDVSEHKLATSADERHLAAQQSQNAKVNSANTPADIISPQIAASLLATPTLGEPSAQDSTDGLTEVSDMDAELSKTDMGSTLLKDAKLSVTLDAQREVRPFVLERNENISTADIKPLSSFSLGATTPAQVNSQESMQVQLSLRQGVEQQNQMQEMIQRFSPVMKQQLITMVSQGIQHAEIRLDPPELGHMLVKIQVHGDQTQVQFHVTQTQTRDLVEQAMPRLRELLQEQGMQLADSHVSQGDQGQRREGSFGEGGGSDGADVDEIPAEELHLGLNQATSVDSGIDYYA